MTTRPFRLAALVAVAVAPGATAQRLAWGEAPGVGSWARYAMTSVEGGETKTGSYQVSCLARKRVDGKNHVWCEIVRSKGRKERIFKILIPEDRVATSDAPLSDAREVVYQEKGKTALRADGAQLASLVTLLESIQGEEPIAYDAKGRDRVVLPGGREVTAFRKAGRTQLDLPGRDPVKVESEIWIAREVPFGVVKRVVTTTEGDGEAAEVKTETLELLETGERGATSAIVGEIKPFNVLDLLLGK